MLFGVMSGRNVFSWLPKAGRGMEDLEQPGPGELEDQHPEESCLKTLVWKRIRRSIVTRNGSEDEQDGDMRG